MEKKANQIYKEIISKIGKWLPEFLVWINETFPLDHSVSKILQS